jgi:segregation and condensation protein A
VAGELLACHAAGFQAIPPDALRYSSKPLRARWTCCSYLIRKQNFILDIPMAAVVTRQYLVYVDEIRASKPELAAEYLLMAAMLDRPSRMLLPPKRWLTGKKPKTPRRAGAPPAGVR